MNDLSDPEYFAARLIAKLNLAGLSVPADASISLVRVLSHMPPNVSVDELRDIVATVFVKDEGDYEKFKQVWDELLGRVPPEQIQIPIEGRSLSEEVLRDVMQRLSKRLGQKSFAPPSVDLIVDYGVRRWRSP